MHGKGDCSAEDATVTGTRASEVEFHGRCHKFWIFFPPSETASCPGAFWESQGLPYPVARGLFRTVNRVPGLSLHTGSELS
jgi:hypothetical protein